MGSQDRHAGSGRGRDRCLDRQGSAQRPGPHKGGPGGQCGWKDQASHSATPRPYSSPVEIKLNHYIEKQGREVHVINGGRRSFPEKGQVLHHLVQEEHLGPTVAVLEDPRQRQLAPETRGGPASWLEPIQELPETPVLEIRPVTPASAPAELEDVPAVASASEPGPELEPYEHTAEPNSPKMGQASRLRFWDLEEVLRFIYTSECIPTCEGQVLHRLVQEEHLGPTVAVLEDPRQMQLAPETQGGPASWLEPVQELPETPVLERRPVSPASAPAVASAPLAGPELEPHEPTAEPSRPYPSRRMGRARHVTWQDEQLGPTVSELEDPRQRQLAPQRRRRPTPRIKLVQRPYETRVPKLRPVSPDSAPAELEDVQAVTSDMDLVPELEPHEPSGSGPMASAGMAPVLVEPYPGPEPAHPCAVSTWDVTRKEEWTILVFPSRLVAEQLTLAFATLYSRINYSECKAYLQKQSQTGDIEHLAPTMHRVLREFDTLVELVTTTCLRTPSMTAQDRARVVEFWIRVAKECLALRNFAALHAILLALQSRALGRLERTWEHVSWKSTRTYKNLTKKVKWVTRKHLLKELDCVLRERQRDRMGPEERKRKGMVPYLGLFLADLPKEKLLEHNEDVATLQDEIMVHKHMAAVYDLERDEHFMSFVQAVEPLDEEQSYTLSCQLEPPGQRAGRKGLLQFLRSHV
ncbi:ral guanine nucleotide dissociation stimulator-like isoform X4 [Manis pentadactyla]|uniref:ral guanine nucleotide dissociation stimulator-like isoform X4 n=1 Tax=Manis pentadactyla TaxID=143292 RepID=UPI00255C934F|nr:ral guanine nucleotide dissociation stimulator-like isoform X4 [Manis pentadactyla]